MCIYMCFCVCVCVFVCAGVCREEEGSVAERMVGGGGI